MLQVWQTRSSSSKLLFKKLLATGKERISPVYINESNNPQKSSATYTNIKIRNTQIKAIVDSDAEVTLIIRSLAKRLHLKVTKTDDNIRYIAANNEVLPHSFTILFIEIGQWKTKQKAIVVKNLSAELLLGTDWLKQQGVIINYQNNLLKCGKFSSKF
jgi:predicted aspartyl protease